MVVDPLLLALGFRFLSLALALATGLRFLVVRFLLFLSGDFALFVYLFVQIRIQVILQ